MVVRVQAQKRAHRRRKRLTVRRLAKEIARRYKKLAHVIKHGTFIPAGITINGDHIELTQRYEDWDDRDHWHEYTLKVWPSGHYEVWFYSPWEGSELLKDSEVPEGVLWDFKMILDMVEALGG